MSPLMCNAWRQDRAAHRHKVASGWRRVRHATESIVARHRRPFAALMRMAPPSRRLRR
jgi:hypothetical protein